MSSIEVILDRLAANPDHVFVVECHADGPRQATGRRLGELVAHYRGGLRGAGVEPGDRCALLGDNSIEWIAADLALLAEGAVAVPLYARRRPAELATILRDADPALLLTDDGGTLGDLERAGAPALDVLPLSGASLGAAGDFAEVEAPEVDPVHPAAADDPVSIIYTSGTSGESKGVVLTRGNLDFMLAATARHLDEATGTRPTAGADRVLHYLPFCFAGSWISLLLALTRRSRLVLNLDFDRLSDDLAAARPHYFQNVPLVLDRLRAGVDAALRARGGPVAALWRRAARGLEARAVGRASLSDRLAQRLASVLLAPLVRRRLGPDLRWLICGSAALSEETRAFFELLRIPVLQVYGLTETTAICTLDSPGEVVAGGVGRALPGVEMRLGDDEEILVRGPNVFAGYWNRPRATEAAFVDDWFRTGDRGAVDAAGYWRVLGRLGDLVVLASGHNVAPEPIEEALRRRLPEAEQVLVLGAGRPHLAAVVTGPVEKDRLDAAIGAYNAGATHYEKIRAFLALPDPFGADSGLVTPNGKLRRGAVEAALGDRIEDLFARPSAGARRAEAIR